MATDDSTASGPDTDVAGPSIGTAAEAARAAFRARIAAPGHAVDNAREAVADLETALAAGILHRTPLLDLMLGDLRLALDGDDEGEAGPLGAKSADAARRITAALGRELDRA